MDCVLHARPGCAGGGSAVDKESHAFYFSLTHATHVFYFVSTLDTPTLDTPTSAGLLSIENPPSPVFFAHLSRAPRGRFLFFLCVLCSVISLAAKQYFDGDLWIEAFEADSTMTESGKTTVVNIYR